ncbi:MAG: hypothetical protein M3396_06090 [Actinomycetota bacterium]|nr:hypothetical protein [Actinomycetota bacterium]MDQ3573485.1 hypothetical protein [Actinomycetota bacterium]
MIRSDGRGTNRRRGVAALLAVVALAAGSLAFAAPSPARAQAGGGSAYGFYATVSLGGGPAETRGPEPLVELPAGGSEAPVTDTQPTGEATFGPAALFKSGQMSVSTQTGPGGEVISSATVQGLANTADRPGPFLYDEVRSTCTGATGSTKISGGVLGTEPVPADPAPNTERSGTVENVGDRYRIVFNEQIPNPDGSITVNGAHMYLLGPIATGELIIAQSVCGATATATTTTTTTTAPTTAAATGAAAPAAGTDSAAGTGSEGVGAASLASTPLAGTGAGGESTVGAAALPDAGSSPLAATAQASGGGGGAYGFYATVSLGGGPAQAKGPEPSVELPPGGSPTPVTATQPAGEAVFGPAELFKSGPLDVSTQTGPGGEVTSSATVQGLANREERPEPFVYDEVSSNCTGASGSTRISGGVLGTEPVPADPAPNTERSGTVENVSDRYRIVFNEQIPNPDGSITVNGAHMYLLGPIATGELIIAQSRCGVGASSGTGPSSPSSPTGSASRSSSPTAPGARSGRPGSGSPSLNRLARTGADTPLLPGVVLVVVGFTMVRLARPRPRSGRA